MAFSLESVLNPGNLNEDYLMSFERPVRLLLNGGDDGPASDDESAGLDGETGTRSPSDSLFVTDTDSQSHTPYSNGFLSPNYSQLRHQFSSSQSSVSVGEDNSMTEVTDGHSQTYAASETTAEDSEADGVCYGMVSSCFCPDCP